MTISCRLACAAALALVATVSAARAETLLATFSYDAAGSFNGPAEWQPFISYGNPGNSGAIVMNDATMTAVDIALGTSFDLTGDLSAFAALAGNGVNDAMHIGIFVPGGTGFNANATELSLMQTATVYVPGIGNPDFAGYTLSRISIVGTGFVLTGSNSPDEINFLTTTQFSFYADDASPSVAPLPAAAPMGLFLFALAIAGAYRRVRAAI